MKILLLEDELSLSAAIAEYLEAGGHLVCAVYDGRDALECIDAQSFDLLILDINVPQIDGLSLLETLHVKKIYIPAIYISALADIEDISRAFALGCYDYLKKPFHLKELALRIEKMMQTASRPTLHVTLSKNYTYDTQNQILYFEKQPQVLSKKQLQIIDILSRNIARVVDFEMFRTYVWDDAIIDNATIRAEVNRLKKSLKEDFILNIRSMGYMIER
ncbi:MAG: response regulator transcription factor [Campylobacterales bacterium]|nr:response regulator transcription factor [Campylobacterales bacterium]